MAFVAGKPAPIFHNLNASDGLHFLAIPLNPAVTASYVPTRLTAADYPGVVPQDQAVDTVAVGAVLVAANLQQGTERYRNLVNFVEAFFTGFQSLLDPGHHPKWHEVSITAELPGWRRFPPAEQWLQRNTQVAAAPNLQDLRSIFSRFIDERQQASGGAPLTPGAKERAVRAIRALAKGAGAVRRCSVPALDFRLIHGTTLPTDVALCGCPCGGHSGECVGRAWR